MCYQLTAYEAIKTTIAKDFFVIISFVAIGHSKLIAASNNIPLDTPIIRTKEEYGAAASKLNTAIDIYWKNKRQVESCIISKASSGSCKTSSNMLYPSLNAVIEALQPLRVFLNNSKGRSMVFGQDKQTPEMRLKVMDSLNMNYEREKPELAFLQKMISFLTLAVETSTDMSLLKNCLAQGKAKPCGSRISVLESKFSRCVSYIDDAISFIGSSNKISFLSTKPNAKQEFLSEMKSTRDDFSNKRTTVGYWTVYSKAEESMDKLDKVMINFNKAKEKHAYHPTIHLMVKQERGAYKDALIAYTTLARSCKSYAASNATALDKIQGSGFASGQIRNWENSIQEMERLNKNVSY